MKNSTKIKILLFFILFLFLPKALEKRAQAMRRSLAQQNKGSPPLETMAPSWRVALAAEFSKPYWTQVGLV